MPTEARCRECGAPLSPDARRTLCPRCLFGLGLAAGAEPLPDAGAPGGVPGPAPGERIRYFGDYELQTEIARGGMGVVWHARQVSLDRPVAIKLILAGELASEVAIERFRREAQAAANLDHPNIVPIYEVGEHAGRHYYAMRLVEGQSLARTLSLSSRRQEAQVPEPPHVGSYTPRAAAALLAKVARAVHHAHQRGILHRDLKPANILLDAHGEPHVTDFGLAKRLDGPAGLTLSDAVLGTVSYMSPEQAQGRSQNLTTATDLWSLGAVLYHLLTGRPPFEAGTNWETLKCVVDHEPSRPRALNPVVDRDLETICLKCLEKDPQRRYGSAAELAEDLEHWLADEPIRARPSSDLERVRKWIRRKPAIAALVGALVLVGLIGFVGVVLAWRDAREQLWKSYLAQAHANRLTGEPGRRFDTLATISKAVAIRPSMELRNEAIACLGLADVQAGRQWELGSRLPDGHGLAFDAAFERYARAHLNGDVSLHRIRDQQELLRLPGVGERTGATLCFSPDGKFLADWYGGRATNFFRVWDLSQRKPVLWRSNPMRDCALAFAPDSRTVAAGDVNLIHLHELPSGREIRTIPTDINPYMMSIDPTGTRLAYCGGHSFTARIVDLGTGQLLQTLKHGTEVTWLAWSPDGKLLSSACLDHRVYLWNPLTGATNALLEGHTSGVVGVVFNRGGDLLLSSSFDGTTRFWDPVTREQLLKLPFAYATFSPFSPDDQWLGSRGGGDNQAGFWKIAPGRECRQIPHPYALHASFDPDGRFLATTSWDGVRLWNLENRELLGQLTQDPSGKIMVHPDGRSLLVASRSALWRRPLAFIPETGEIQVGPAENLWDSEIYDFSLTRDGATLVAAQANGAGVLVFDLRHAAKPRLLPAQAGVILVSLSPDGQWLATSAGYGQGIKLWNMASGTLIKEIPGLGNPQFGFSPDVRHLVFGSRLGYRIWKTGSWEPVGGLQRDRVPTGGGARLVHSPDGQTVAVLRGRAHGITLLDLDSGRELATIDQGYPLCFNADGSQIAAYNDETRKLMIWDLRRVREELAALKLDWEQPPLPGQLPRVSPSGERAASPAPTAVKPLRLTILDPPPE